MKNKKITRKITQGMYVLTTNNGGCIVDAVSQVSATDQPLIAVAVMKKNYTNELLKKNTRFALSVLSKSVNPNIIKTFGLNSMRDINKFENIETTTIEDVRVINDSLGYMIAEIIDSIDNDTHTLFIGKLIEADVFKEEEPMSYAYYQENKNDLNTCEFLIPEVLNDYVKQEKGKVYIIETSAVWYGVTYKEDKEMVVEALKKLTDENIYPQNLWKL